MLSAVVLVSTLFAPVAAEATSPSPHLVKLANTSEKERGIAAKAFHKFLKREDRKRSGWTVLVSGTTPEARARQAARVAEAAGAVLKPVRLVDLRGKFIGETEKNLAALFDPAASKDWILFFDEADALFGKRTDVKDSHDKYANQEVSYLLERIAEHADVVIVGAAPASDDLAPPTSDWVDATVLAEPADLEQPLRWHALCWPPR